ncbi:MAG TPA: efflux RND transporter periplasmic adaptor subunit [Trichormus sp.]|jgi:RND family efflux transporter MFP subunit
MKQTIPLVIFAGLCLSSCQSAPIQPPTAAEASNPPPLMQLPITAVTAKNLRDQLALPGIVFALPDHSVKVSPGVAGKLVEVRVSPGQQVKKGEVIAVLDRRQLSDQANQAHAKVLVADAGVEQAKTNLVLTQNTAERTQRLVQQELAAEKDLVVAKSQVETAKAQLVAAQAIVIDAVAAERATQAQLSYTQVKSPIDGLVAQRFLNVSDTADTATPVAQIVDLSQVIVEAALPTSQPATINHGDSATITAMSLSGHHLSGTVQSINPVTDNQGTTVGIRILCSNPQNMLKEGMPVTATILIGMHNAALTVPVTALVADPTTPDQKMVYIYKDGRVSRVPVTTGIQKDGQVEIKKGLSAGQKIVAAGGYGIPDGTLVEAQSAPLRASTKLSSTRN